MTDAVFIPDSSLCITASGDGFLRLWDTKNGALLARLEGHYAGIARLVLDAGSSRLVSEARDGMGIVWDIADLRNRAKDSKRILARLTGLSGRYAAVSISAGGRWVVTEHGNLGARLWDLAKIQPGMIPRGAALHDEQGMISAVAFSPAADCPRFVTAGIDGSAWVGIAEPKTEKEKRPIFLAGLHYAASGVSFSADGKLVAAASGDNHVHVWDSETGRAYDFGPIPLSGSHPVFSPAGRWLLARSGSISGPALLLDLAGKNPLRQSLEVATGFMPAVFSADAKRIATWGYDRVLRIWHTETAEQLNMPAIAAMSQRETGGPLNCLAYRGDGRGVILGWGAESLENEESARNSAIVYDVLSGQQIGKPLVHNDPVNAALFSPDGKMIATMSGHVASSLKPDNTAKLWRQDRSTGSWVLHKVLDGHKEVVIGGAFSADSRFLATASRDNTARVWKTETGELIAVLDSHKGDVSSLAFSPEGRFILSSSFQDGTARIWDVTTYQGEAGNEIAKVARNRELSTFQGGYTSPAGGFTPGLATVLQAMGDVTSAAFSSDGKTVITASGDGTARTYVCELCGGLDELSKLVTRRPIVLGRDKTPVAGRPQDEKSAGWTQYFEENGEIEEMEKSLAQEKKVAP